MAVLPSPRISQLRDLLNTDPKNIFPFLKSHFSNPTSLTTEELSFFQNYLNDNNNITEKGGDSIISHFCDIECSEFINMKINYRRYFQDESNEPEESSESKEKNQEPEEKDELHVDSRNTLLKDLMDNYLLNEHKPEDLILIKLIKKVINTNSIVLTEDELHKAIKNRYNFVVADILNKHPEFALIKNSNGWTPIASFILHNSDIGYYGPNKEEAFVALLKYSQSMLPSQYLFDLAWKEHFPFPLLKMIMDITPREMARGALKKVTGKVHFSPKPRFCELLRTCVNLDDLFGELSLVRNTYSCARLLNSVKLPFLPENWLSELWGLEQVNREFKVVNEEVANKTTCAICGNFMWKEWKCEAVNCEAVAPFEESELVACNAIAPFEESRVVACNATAHKECIQFRLIQQPGKSIKFGVWNCIKCDYLIRNIEPSRQAIVFSNEKLLELQSSVVNVKQMAVTCKRCLIPSVIQACGTHICKNDLCTGEHIFYKDFICEGCKDKKNEVACFNCLTMLNFKGSYYNATVRCCAKREYRCEPECTHFKDGKQGCGAYFKIRSGLVKNSSDDEY